MRCGQFDGLVELATICALCNDSALDYNEVGPPLLSMTPLGSVSWDRPFSFAQSLTVWGWCSSLLQRVTLHEHGHMNAICMAGAEELNIQKDTPAFQEPLARPSQLPCQAKGNQGATEGF